MTEQHQPKGLIASIRAEEFLEHLRGYYGHVSHTLGPYQNRWLFLLHQLTDSVTLQTLKLIEAKNHWPTCREGYDAGYFFVDKSASQVEFNALPDSLESPAGEMPCKRLFLQRFHKAEGMRLVLQT